jgi:hypothetical protein
VDDGSTDRTWELPLGLRARAREVKPVKSQGLRRFGRGVVCGLDQAQGDAVVVVMADERDDCQT